MGVIASVRKIQTKTGKMMMTAVCESFDFTFIMVIFPKDYDTFASIVVEDTIAVVEGNLKTNLLNGEISVIVQSLKTATITNIRTQAAEMGLFNEQHKVNLFADVQEAESYTITVPKTAKKDDLVQLKAFLETVNKGGIKVELLIAEQKVDTKIAIENTETLEDWLQKKGW